MGAFRVVRDYVFMEKVELEITFEDGVAVVAFNTASICAPEAITKTAEQIRSFVEENHPRVVLFDFKEVRFFSSQVLGVLLDIRARLKQYDGEVIISAIDPRLYRVFKITNLDKIFTFFPDKESAVKAIQAD